MCGLTGFWQRSNFYADSARVVAEKMAERIAHRGPDDMGMWAGLIKRQSQASLPVLSA